MLFYFFYIYAMKKYLFWLLAVPIMSPLLSLASAQDYSYVEDSDSDNLYSPTSLVSDWGDISNFVLWDCDHSTCEFSIMDSSSSIVYSVSNDCTAESLSNCFTSLNWKSLDSWTYSVWANNYDAFSSVSFSIGSISSWGSDSVLPELSVPSSFTSWITSLVNNFWSTISEWIPVVILLTLWITCIYALFRVVRNYARRSFKW